MNNQWINFLINRHKNKFNEGFTLIELLVTIIIIGVLSAIALPSFLSQVGKARESEAKNNLGTLSRAQQGYHFENQVFADSLNRLASNTIFESEYYNYPNADVANNNILTQRAVSIDSNSNRTRDYALGVYFNAGSYTSKICESSAVGQTVEAPTIATDPCTNGGIELN
ncbi:prepilin-type N-terminal cleavage/methylation domain-containing protein [Waterburya agarophytonicola K14]|uniref:Prepilin-type N-terminal cleavage/methylation domain-containing protein n=1 Tax=Waterburya agarophytonicola KI4 TaxID=2874699 RepID=A0A964BNT8_9CYAN|nr:type IV pilin-like G/H family protein [Waterburya agarophytonicola]MCC0175577.1 prepilin-type N-terminal cleavage/methylation domain-containing protein [Waterburya agarophytonicola KI4]